MQAIVKTEKTDENNNFDKISLDKLEISETSKTFVNPIERKSGEGKSIESQDEIELASIKSELSGRPRLDSDVRTPVLNPNLLFLKHDHLYHLGMETSTTNFKKKFGDTRFVCVGGTASRMKTLANQIFTMIHDRPPFEDLVDFAKSGGRYSLYKVGPCVFVNHNIGASPLGVVLHEIFKLLHYAGVKNEDVTMFRIGTSGGLGYPPGTVVVTDSVIDAAKRNHFHSLECGIIRPLPCRINQELVEEILEAAKAIGVPTVKGGTMGTDDFYLGQGRTDGAFCNYTEADKMAFLQELYQEYNVCNIEMEAHILSAFTYRAGIRCGIVCTTIVNRLKGDIIQFCHDDLAKFERRPLDIITEFIKQRIGS